MRFLLPFFLIYGLPAFATDYHVGPAQALSAITDVPWSTLQAGDKVYIHWKSTAYKEKWVLNRQGTAANRIEVIGINGPNGQKPVIDGNGASTPTVLSYWNENRGVLKIGGSSVPSDAMPSYLTIENLEIRSSRPPYSFTDDNGNTGTYVNNAAAIYIEKGQHIIIRNCTLRDCGNGLFIGAHNGDTQEILIEKNHIYDNGNDGSIYEHNTYTAGINITYQYNHFGPLRSGAGGNNLKDRSAGLVVRYNWIENGNRQLDLVDAEDSQVLVNHANYHKTHVYGNLLIEPEGAGNSQMVHYGGDSGTETDYRKGDLYFYNNTVISTRTGNTTLMRLSTNDETAHVFNNIIYTSAAGNKFAMIGGDGTFNMHHNWLKTDWVACHCTPSGSVNDQGNNLTGSDPLFVNFSTQDFMLNTNSPSINQGASIPAYLLPAHDVAYIYQKHGDSESRTIWNKVDVGAFEFSESLCTDITEFESGSWSNGTPNDTKRAILKSNYSTSTYGNIDACACTVEAGSLLTITAGMQLKVEEDLSVKGFLDAHQGAMIDVQGN
ncbi:MAG: polysaccharide-degrading enzyme [Saprospiraceae bacterium]|nr:polysaccharide-degrading enzyme [Saprospiraceae bacterium]